MSSTILRVLLDSTYLLPSLGIEVEGISNEHIVRLMEAAARRRVKFCCLTASWVEVIGKVCREAQRLKLDLKEILDIPLKSLVESGFYEWIGPTYQAVKLAFKLRMLGHRDNVDNLLYATSITNRMVFLTMDEELKGFLSRQGYETDNLLTHTQLLSRIERSEGK